MLGGIQRGIGKLNQVALELGVGVINRNPNAYSEMLDQLRGACKKFCLLHRPAQALGHIEGARLGGFRQDNDKLLAAMGRFNTQITAYTGTASLPPDELDIDLSKRLVYLIVEP